SGVRTEGDRRPVLTAPVRRAKSRGLIRPRFAFGIDIRPPGLGVQAFKNVLLHERSALDEVDRAAGALEEPQIAVAGHVDQAFDGSSVALVVDQNRWRNFIPVPSFFR